MNCVNFEVGDKQLKLRLGTKETVELEKKLGTNPVNEVLKCMAGGGQMPSYTFVAATLQASLQKLEHGYTTDKVYDLMDEYFEEGHNLMDLVPVIMEVFQQSGQMPKGEIEDQDPKQ